MLCREIKFKFIASWHRRKLIHGGIEPNTRNQHDNLVKHWFDFSDLFNIELLNYNEENASFFIAWCFEKISLNSCQVSKTLTALSGVLKEQGVSFNRKSFPAIKRALNGFFNSKPPQRRDKKPFCGEFVVLIFKYVDLKEFI